MLASPYCPNPVQQGVLVIPSGHPLYNLRSNPQYQDVIRQYLGDTAAYSNMYCTVHDQYCQPGQAAQDSQSFAEARQVLALAERYESMVREAGSQTVGIAHADCPEDAALLAALLRRRFPPREIMTVCYEPVTGSHVGPGTLALFFFGAEAEKAAERSPRPVGKPARAV